MSVLKVGTQVLKGLTLGLAAAVLGTVMHQTVISGFPFGITLALLMVLGFGLRARKARLQGWIYALSLAILVFLFGQSGNQDTMIPATTLGYSWGYGSMALAIFIAMFPRFKKH